MTLLHSNLFIANKTFLAVVSFFLQQARSNVHSVRATTTDKDPLAWNFNPKVLSPIFTLLTLCSEILTSCQITIPFVSCKYSSCKVATVREFTCINPEKVLFGIKPLTHLFIIENLGKEGLCCRKLLKKKKIEASEVD